MSLDDTALSVFSTHRPPLGLLVAGRATDMLATRLDETQRAPFEALTRALEGWWPHKSPDAEKIYAEKFTACLEQAGEGADHQAVMRSAHVQLRALLEVRPKSLPPGPHYDMGPEDFVAVLREGAKVVRLPLAQLDARLKLLLERKKEKWPKLVERTRRMSWDRGVSWGKLDKRVKALAAIADLGAHASWVKVGAQSALRLELDDIKRITVLEPEELEQLRGVIPTIPSEP